LVADLRVFCHIPDSFRQVGHLLQAGKMLSMTVFKCCGLWPLGLGAVKCCPGQLSKCQCVPVYVGVWKRFV